MGPGDDVAKESRVAAYGKSPVSTGQDIAILPYPKKRVLHRWQQGTLS